LIVLRGFLSFEDCAVGGLLPVLYSARDSDGLKGTKARFCDFKSRGWEFEDVMGREGTFLFFLYAGFTIYAIL
jgi:hypothetical protein